MKQKHLGQKSEINYSEPSADILDTFKSVNSEDMEIYIKAVEFTSLCPVTGQPDYGTIEIWYRPNKLCVESKSLKLYFGAFRMYQGFHEACINKIFNDIFDVVKPKWMKIYGGFNSRGGIYFHPSIERGEK